MGRTTKAAIGAGVVGAVVLAFAFVALGGEQTSQRRSSGTTAGPAGGGMAMCVENVPDCDDMIVVPGGEEPVTIPSGDNSAVHDVGEEPTATPPQPETVEPNAHAVDLRARPFDSATVGDDGRTIAIDFVSGVEPCYVLGRVDVEEGPGAITITLFEGQLDVGDDVACIDIGVFKRTTVTLDEPVGDRAIVDGAA